MILKIPYMTLGCVVLVASKTIEPYWNSKGNKQQTAKDKPPKTIGIIILLNDLLLLKYCKE